MRAWSVPAGLLLLCIEKAHNSHDSWVLSCRHSEKKTFWLTISCFCLFCLLSFQQKLIFVTPPRIEFFFLWSAYEKKKAKPVNFPWRLSRFAHFARFHSIRLKFGSASRLMESQLCWISADRHCERRNKLLSGHKKSWTTMQCWCFANC